MTDGCDPLTSCEPELAYTPAEANYTSPEGNAETESPPPETPRYVYTFDYYEPASHPYTLAEAGREFVMNSVTAIAAPVALLGGGGNAGCRGDSPTFPPYHYRQDAGPRPPALGQDAASDRSQMTPDPDAGRSADGPSEPMDREDAGVETETGPVPAAEVLQEGTGGFLLRGVVLKPDEVLDPGEVLIIGNEIVCVDTDCSDVPGYDEVTWIDTHGIISPGLIDSHNHVAYNFLPEWVAPGFFNNRYEWSDDATYEEHIAPYADNRSSNDTFCPAAKWGELRSLVHGTTTMQEHPSAQGSCINWGVRDANLYHGLGYDHVDPYIASVRDINDDAAADIVAGFESADEPTTRFHVHMAEGVSEDHIDEEFASYAGRDPRTNRHNGTTLLGPESILIHSVALTDAELVEAAEAGAKMVWSPSSNMVLYGATADIQRILDLGIMTALGPDWTVSGADNMPEEMRFALAYARGEVAGSVESPLVTPERLWKMATADGAVVLDLDGTRPGLEGRIGKLEEGYRADVSVFAVDPGTDPHEALINSRAADVRLVMIDGAVFYGDSNLGGTARNDYCEDFDACGTEKFICVQDSPTAGNRRDETLADIQEQLTGILAGYGREDDLLPLVDCEK